MNKKNRTSIVIIGLLSVVVLTACGKDNKTLENTEYTSYNKNSELKEDDIKLEDIVQPVYEEGEIKEASSESLGINIDELNTEEKERFNSIKEIVIENATLELYDTIILTEEELKIFNNIGLDVNEEETLVLEKLGDNLKENEKINNITLAIYTYLDKDDDIASIECEYLDFGINYILKTSKNNTIIFEINKNGEICQFSKNDELLIGSLENIYK